MNRATVTDNAKEETKKDRSQVSSHQSYRNALNKSASKQHYSDIDYLFKKDPRNLQRSAAYQDSCAYTIPHVQSANSEETVMTTASGRRYKVRTELSKSLNRDDYSADISCGPSISSHNYRVANPNACDNKSCTSYSSTFSVRISKMLKPKWVKRRQEKKRKKKQMSTNVKHEQSVQTKRIDHLDDESIATALSLHEIPIGAPVIENIESLDYLSCNSLQYEYITGTSSHSRSSRIKQATSQKKSSQKFKFNAQSKSTKIQNDIKHTFSLNRSKSDPTARVLQFEETKCMKEKKNPEQKSLHRSRSDNQRRSTLDSTMLQKKVSKPTSSKDTIYTVPSTAAKSEKTMKVSKPQSMQRAKSDSPVLLKSSERNRTNSELRNIVRRSHLSRSSSDSPIVLKRSPILSSPISSSKFRTPQKRNNLDNSYASHYLDTPSSIGSAATFRGPSLSAFLESPSRSKQGDRHSDSCSVRSGVSMADSCSSMYSALSNISYKDPCAKQSKIVKRSNLKLSGGGDGDIWVEKIFVSKRTAKRRTFFVSVATGRRCRDEPPTGASKIIYQDDLKELRRIERDEQMSKRRSQLGEVPCSIGGLYQI